MNDENDDGRFERWRQSAAALRQVQIEALQAVNREPLEHDNDICEALSTALERVLDDRGFWTDMTRHIRRVDELEPLHRTGLQTLINVDWTPFLAEAGYHTPPPPTAHEYSFQFRSDISRAIAGDKVSVREARTKIRELAWLLRGGNRGGSSPSWWLQKRRIALVAALPAIGRVALTLGVAAAIGSGVGALGLIPLAPWAVGAIEGAVAAGAELALERSFAFIPGPTASRSDILDGAQPGLSDETLQRLQERLRALAGLMESEPVASPERYVDTSKNVGLLDVIIRDVESMLAAVFLVSTVADGDVRLLNRISNVASKLALLRGQLYGISPLEPTLFAESARALRVDISEINREILPNGPIMDI